MKIQGYSFDFFRNLKDYKYSNQLTLAEKNEVRNKLLSEISSLSLPFKYIPSYNEDREYVEDIESKNLLSMGVLNSDVSVLYDESSGIFIKINDNEHLTFSGFTLGDPIKKYNELQKMVSSIEGDILFQKDRNFGYLSSQIPLCGNGFMIDSIVHIPALMNSNKVMYMANKAMRRPGTLLIPYTDKKTPSAFFIVRCISKTEPIDDIKFVKNIVEELSVKEEVEAAELANNNNFFDFLTERINQARESKRIDRNEFLRALDDYVLFRKIIGESISEDKIRDLLIKSQKIKFDNHGLSEDEEEKYFYDLIYSGKEELNDWLL